MLHLYYFRLLWQGFVGPHETYDKNEELMLTAPELCSLNHILSVVESAYELLGDIVPKDTSPAWMFVYIWYVKWLGTKPDFPLFSDVVNSFSYGISVRIFGRYLMFVITGSTALRCARVKRRILKVIKLRPSTKLPYLALKMNYFRSRYPVSFIDPVGFQQEAESNFSTVVANMITYDLRF